MYPGGDTNTVPVFGFLFLILVVMLDMVSTYATTSSVTNPSVNRTCCISKYLRVPHRARWMITFEYARIGGRGIVSAAAGVNTLSVTSAISPNEVHGIFINLTSIRLLLALYEDLIVESTKSAILVFCSKSFPIGSRVIGSLA